MNEKALAALSRAKGSRRARPAAGRDPHQLIDTAKSRGRKPGRVLDSTELAAKLEAVRRQTPKR